MRVMSFDPIIARAAFEARDRNFDGQFVGAVQTTRIYCKPSCPARHPKPENVTFYATPEEARAAGYRACLRCKPDEVGRDRIAVADAVAAIEASEEAIRSRRWRSGSAMRRIISTGCSSARPG